MFQSGHTDDNVDTMFAVSIAVDADAVLTTGHVFIVDTKVSHRAGGMCYILHEILQ